MEWLKGKANPYFVRAFVNRVWAGYFHRGIVEPADDLNLDNARVNAELLDYLTDGFVAKGYDMRWLHREILNSDTYQRCWSTNATNKHDGKNFSHAVIRRLPAETAMAAIMMATANSGRVATFASDIGDRNIGPAGIQAPSGGGGKQAEGYALAIFGKPPRETNCDCERVTDPTLLQTIYTRNDQSILRRIDEGGGWIGELKAASKLGPPNADAAIREVFLRTVSRPPTSAEFAQAQADIAAAKTPLDGIRDLRWAKLNTREFLVNR